MGENDGGAIHRTEADAINFALIGARHPDTRHAEGRFAGWFTWQGSGLFWPGQHQQLADAKLVAGDDGAVNLDLIAFGR